MISNETVSKAINYGLSVRGAPYHWWLAGEVPEGPPAWAENAPPPPPEEVINGGCFCAGVPNLMLRAVGKEIPGYEEESDEPFDGGTLAYGDYYADVAEPFDESQTYPPGTLIGRYFSWDRLAYGDQGHVAVVLEDGYLLQSYDADGYGNPGVNTDDHINDAELGYYEYAVRPEHWLEDPDGRDSVGDPGDDPGNVTVETPQILVDDFIYLCQQLKGPEYRYTGGRDGSDYEYCQQHGVDCSGMFDVVLRYMGLKGEDESWGTVALASFLVGFDGTGGPEPYDPDKLYPKGTVIVNDNATDWGDPSTNASHVAMIVEDELLIPGQPGQRIIHSRPPEGVADWETDYQTHYDWQSTWPGWIGYEWAGFLPELLSEEGIPADPGTTPSKTGSTVSEGGSLLTADQLVEIMSNNLSYERAEYLLPYLTDALEEFEINTKSRIAMFLANVAVETGELQWFQELDNWEGTFLANQPYYPYYGRGVIHLTWYENYVAAGDFLGEDLANDPDRAKDDDVAFRIAGWYWTQWGNDLREGSWPKDLNEFADAGDFDATCFGVNGGWNGYEDRVWYYNVACQVLGV